MPAPNPGYKVFDKTEKSEANDRIERQMAEWPADKPVIVRDFTTFSCAIQKGLKRITYISHNLVMPDGGTAMFWINKNHAQKIGESLNRRMDFFCLALTTAQPGAFKTLVDSVPPGTVIDELIIAHKSGDAVNKEEAQAWAELVTKCGVKTFKLWATEFDPGTLDLLCDELVRLENKTLLNAEVCNTTIKEPNDVIKLEKLDAILAANKSRK